MRRTLSLLALAATTLAASPALAGAFLLPSNFGPTRDLVTIQAGQSEAYFTSGGAIRAPGDFTAIDPKGATVKLGAGTNFRELTILEAPIPSDGTWRITTGDRVQRTAKWARINGEWKQIRQPQPAGRGPGGPGGAPGGPPGGRGGNQVEESAVPADAERMDAVSLIKAETYVSRNKPDKAALASTGKGFELSPITHPNEVYAEEAFKFTLLSDGKPVAGLAFTVAKGGEQYVDSPFHTDGKTDAQGQGAIKLKDPGVYVLEASWSPLGGAPAPGAAPAPLTVAYTLTFEVTR
jgi:hypothetical protein